MENTRLYSILGGTHVYDLKAIDGGYFYTDGSYEKAVFQCFIGEYRTTAMWATRLDNKRRIVAISGDHYNDDLDIYVVYNGDDIYSPKTKSVTITNVIEQFVLTRLDDRGDHFCIGRMTQDSVLRDICETLEIDFDDFNDLGYRFFEKVDGSIPFSKSELLDYLVENNKIA